MIVITREYVGNNCIRTVRCFKRKGLRYFLYILSLKIYRIDYETIRE